MNVPFLDLKLQYKEIGTEITRRFQNIFESSSFILGKEVQTFENDFARYIGAKYCVALNSGTSALHLALLSQVIGKGDEVITVPNSFIATAEAISYTGATPVFVDVDPETLLMSPENFEKAITPRTKAVIPVHLFGQACAMTRICSIAKSKNIIVIEDACQAHGAKYGEKNVGAFGSASAFSFYPGKNLGAYGEGGALITDDERIYNEARMLRDHGQSQKHHHHSVGYNYRMDAFQGAVLNVKLKRIELWNRLRRQNAQMYGKYLAESPVRFIRENAESRGVYHLMVVRAPQREKLRQFLDGMGIQTGIHYPIPIHLQKAYDHLGHQKGDFPNCESASAEILSLPMYPELLTNQISYVCHCVNEFYKDRGQQVPRLQFEEATGV